MDMLYFKAKMNQMDAGVMTLTHRPKGRMCAVCLNCSEDCSKLDFNSMRVIGQDWDKMFVVKCTNFEKRI